MNFSNPKPIKTNHKNKSGFMGLIEKISALIGLIEISGSMATPDRINKKVTPKQRDRIVLIIIMLIIYFVLMGIFSTFYFINKFLFS